MEVVEPVGTNWRRVRWPLLVVVLVVVPGVAVFGNWAIFHLFGNGRFLPYGSTGSHVLHWWDGWGRPLTVGVGTWVLLTICRIRPLSRILLALASAGASFVWVIAAVIIALLLNPGALD